MTKETMKVIQNKQKRHPYHDWWQKHGYKVLRVIFFPIWFFIVVIEKIHNKVYTNIDWDEERVNKVLNYYIPRVSTWKPKEKVFYFFDNGFGWNLCFAKKHLKRKERRFWKKFTGLAGGEIKEYLIKSFELEGFNKEIISTWSTTLEIIFTQK